MKSRSIRLRRAVNAIRWNVVKKFNRVAYLRHFVDLSSDSDDVDWHSYEELQAIETRKWTTRGWKVYVSVTDIPELDKEKLWKEGVFGSYVDQDTLRKFKKLVVDAEYERNRRRREWITAIGVIVAALGALANLYFTLRGRKP